MRQSIAAALRGVVFAAWPVRMALAVVVATTIACADEPTETAGDDVATAAAETWTRTPPPADFEATRPLRVGFLVVDGVYNSELMAPYDVFHHTPFHTKPNPGMEVFTVSPDGAAVTTFEGLRLEPHYSFADAPSIDVLVVPSAEHSMTTDLDNEALIDWVRRVGQNARYVLSLCDGAFVLAAAGLLDGHAVTTFPTDQDAFAERFPALDLRRGPSFIHDGKALTSEGGSLSYDVAMYLVEHLYGSEVAAGVGRGLLIAWPPEPEPFRALVVRR